MYARRTLGPYVPIISLALLLLAIGGLGYLGFLAFVKGVLAPKEFATYGLVLTTLAAATASFFSPCSFTVLPSYLAFASSGGPPQGGQKTRSRDLGSCGFDAPPPRLRQLSYVLPKEDIRAESTVQ